MEHHDIIGILQAGGTPVMGLIGYMLWNLNRQMTSLKVSVDTLVETLIRFVPGIQGPPPRREPPETWILP